MAGKLNIKHNSLPSREEAGAQLHCKAAVESGIPVPSHAARGKHALHSYAATTVAEHVLRQELSIHTTAPSLCYWHSDTVCGMRYTGAYQTAGNTESGVVQNSLQHQWTLGKTSTLLPESCEAA